MNGVVTSAELLVRLAESVGIAVIVISMSVYFVTTIENQYLWKIFYL
jgi:hypothetical protein